MASSPAASPSFLRRIFVSPDRRLRSGWRLLIHAILTLMLTLVFGVPSVLVLMAIGVRAESLALVLEAIPACLAFLCATILARRLLDRRSFTSLGLRLHRGTWADLAAGIAIAAAMMGCIFLAEVALGWVRIDGIAWQTQSASAVLTGFLVSLILFVLVGIYEEVFSRGYQLQNLADGLGLPWGLVLSSLIFAVMHLGNPSAAWAPVLIGLTASGLFLAFGWVRTRELWLPIGLHIGWNLFEGPVFGFPVSGLSTSRLLLQTPTGPAWATGGSFGPESGAVLLPGLLLGTCLIWLYTARRQPLPPNPSAPHAPTD